MVQMRSSRRVRRYSLRLPVDCLRTLLMSAEMPHEEILSHERQATGTYRTVEHLLWVVSPRHQLPDRDLLYGFTYDSTRV